MTSSGPIFSSIKLQTRPENRSELYSANNSQQLPQPTVTGFMSAIPKYISAYPEHLQTQVQHLVDQDQLGQFLLNRYPQPHNVKNDGALRDYTMDIKQQYLKKSDPLSKVVFDNKIHVVNNALGLHTYSSRVTSESCWPTTHWDCIPICPGSRAANSRVRMRSGSAPCSSRHRKTC